MKLKIREGNGKLWPAGHVVYVGSLQLFKHGPINMYDPWAFLNK